MDTARAYYGLGCTLGALGSTEEALENLNRAHEVQKRFYASEHDIDKTEQEINRLRGKRCRMLQQMILENNIVTGHNVVAYNVVCE